MKEKFIKFNKLAGETPLEAINRFRTENLVYADAKLAYAGRLDPMASGELVILVDDECKNRDFYQKLDKTYTFDLLLGVETDSLDFLGKIVKTDLDNLSMDYSGELEELVRNFPQEISQTPPLYSSVRVDGKPLLWYAKRAIEVEIPSNVVQIYDIKLRNSTFVNLKEFIKEQINIVKKVNGDFRQNEIVKEWEEFEKNNLDSMIQLYNLEAKVSSGTYIRSLARDIANELGTVGIAVNINRKSIMFLNP